MVSEAEELTVDSPVAPRRVLGSHAKDEPPDLDGGGWPTTGAGWLSPASGDASSMPAKESVGGDQPANLAPVASGSCPFATGLLNDVGAMSAGRRGGGERPDCCHALGDTVLQARREL